MAERKFKIIEVNEITTKDGKKFNEIAQSDTRYLSSETAGGFTGIILALFCQSASETSKPKADFYSFNYHPVKTP